MPPVRLAAIVLLLVVPFLPACEGPRTLAGHVRDGAGNPVPHARLRAADLTGRAPVSETDSLGWFRFDLFTSSLATRASLQVDAPGYHSRFVRLPFRDDVEVVLTPDSVPLRGPQWSDAETGPIGGIHLGIPLRWSTSFGIARGQMASSDDFRAWFVVVEPGGGGVKGRVGVVRLWPHLGAQLSLAALRTSGHTLTVAPDQSFGGAEARVHLEPITLTLGGYRRFDGSAPGDGRLLSVGLGLGF